MSTHTNIPDLKYCAHVDLSNVHRFYTVIIEKKRIVRKAYWDVHCICVIGDLNGVEESEGKWM